MLERFTAKTVEVQPLADPPLEVEELGFNECTFTWEDPSDRRGNTRGGKGRMFKLKFTEKLVFERGHINLIVGPTGCGKVRIPPSTCPHISNFHECKDIYIDGSSWWNALRTAWVELVVPPSSGVWNCIRAARIMGFERHHSGMTFLLICPLSRS